MRFFLIPASFLFIALISLSCGSDEPTEDVIHYDGPNSSSPLLPQGSQEMGVYFPTSELDGAVGRDIKNIRFFVYSPPDDIRIRIYEGSSSSQPGSLLYDQPVVGLVRENTWNIHTLANSFEITGEPLWIGIQFTNPATQQTIGCDAGPAVNGADWLNQSTDNQWRTFRERTGESVNWNIRLELN